ILPFWIKLGYSKNIFIQTIFITLISLVLYILFNFLINNEKISIHANNFIVIYILFLIAITFFKARTNNMSFIFNPFDSIYNLKYEILSPLINIVGNLLMYIPIGIYIKFKFNKNITTMIVIFIIYILLVELTQGITKTGIFDANDIIMNTLGFIIGMKLISKY
ncbi:VanZ family protein, partial [Clostridium sp.]|uniref:VanZ family protein n=1 Tax=Clostridium sp. TaxID=1506 RepID=UPI0026DC3A5F